MATKKQRKKAPRRPFIPPNKTHRDKKNDYQRAEKHPKLKWKLVTEVDGDWRD